MVTRKAGRPVGGDSDARARLIEAARPLFLKLPYEKVSTRMVAEKAEVNVALIRYYFQNKAGLFEAMIVDTMAPMHTAIEVVMENGGFESVEGLMRTYYRTMAPFPDFPRLIYRVMAGDDEGIQRQIIDKQFSRFVKPLHQSLFYSMPELAEGVDPIMARLSFLSLMIFPFIIPKGFSEMQGVDINEDFLMQWAEHNLALLDKGMLNQQAHSKMLDSSDKNSHTSLDNQATTLKTEIKR